jgi:diacylglycerol kinase (ATP)
MHRGTPLLDIMAPGRPPLQGRLVLVGNGVHYGGPFRVFPDASFTDGLLDVVVVENPGLISTMHMSLAALRRRYPARVSGLTYFQTAELTVTSAVPVPVQADGDLCSHTPVHFRLAPFPLRVIT